MFERDCDDKVSMREPILYQAGQKKVYFNFKVFWLWIGLSVLHGAAAFYITIYVILTLKLNSFS